MKKVDTSKDFTGSPRKINKKTKAIETMGETPMKSMERNLASLIDKVNKTRNGHLEVKEEVKLVNKAFKILKEQMGRVKTLDKDTKVDKTEGKKKSNVIMDKLNKMEKRMAKTEESFRKFAETRSHVTTPLTILSATTPHTILPYKDRKGTRVQVIKKAKNKKTPPVDKPLQTTGSTINNNKSKVNRPPAILIKIGEGRSYADTVAALRKSNDLTQAGRNGRTNKKNKDQEGRSLAGVKEER